MHLKHWIILMILIFPIAYGHSNAVVFRAIRGEDARLPCGQGKVFLDGPDSFVLWVKNNRELKYRYPSEGANIYEGSIFNTAYSSAESPAENTSLYIKEVNEQDEGRYSCRIHYQASPSVDYIIDLKLVESPGIPKIFTSDKELVTSSVLGPYGLGSNITLTCEIRKDQPDALLYWKRNSVTVDSVKAFIRDGVKVVVMNIFNMTRDEQGARYECVVQNSDVSRPLVSGLVIKMFLPPLLVEIRLNNNLNFEAGQPRVVDCVVVGCIPPPSITWHLGNHMLRSNVHKELHDGNYTVSSLTLAPSYGDTNKQLVCSAHNSLIPDEIFQTNVTVNVGYRPVCITPRGSMVGVIDGEAELVTCNVEASSPPLQFSWTFSNSRTLYTSGKVIPGEINRYFSSLLWVPEAGDIGELLCRAMNTIGEQKQPCTFIIAKGGPPDTPDCHMSKSQINTIRIQCKKTWDGGRPQTIHLELLNGAGKLMYNVSDTVGTFQMNNIIEQHNITAVVFASNARGRSEPLVTQLITKKPTKQQVFEVQAQTWAAWLEFGFAVLSVTTMGVIIVKCMVDCRNTRRNRIMNPEVNLANDEFDIGMLMINLWFIFTGLYIYGCGVFHREPDFTREERVIGTTNITVNQVAPCQNEYTPSPISGPRQLVRCSEIIAPDNVCLTSQHAYYV